MSKNRRFIIHKSSLIKTNDFETKNIEKRETFFGRKKILGLMTRITNKQKILI
jgi:hypothetical protein